MYQSKAFTIFFPALSYQVTIEKKSYLSSLYLDVYLLNYMFISISILLASSFYLSINLNCIYLLRLTEENGVANVIRGVLDMGGGDMEDNMDWQKVVHNLFAL